MNELQEIRAGQIASGELWEELGVEHHWFHVVRGLIYRGEIARIGAVAWAVYCSVKAHTKLDTGDAYPSIERIADQVGVSHDTVQRAMKRLVEADLLTVEKRGRRNIYSLTEKVAITRPDGELWGTAQRKYSPLGFPDFIDELKRVARTGNAPGDRAITINVTVNVQQITQGDGGSVTMNVQNFQVASDKAEPAEMAELRQRLKQID
jgi:DNA-binding transcriptional ArsR family regulator